jgi:hypothetical protein
MAALKAKRRVSAVETGNAKEMSMGWTYTHKPAGQKILDFFVDHGVLRWPDDNPREHRVLDTALVNLTEFYVALEVTDKASGERYVTALVILVRMTRDHRYNFGWKDMSEAMGPYQTNCPERILKLLTPTEHEWAAEWRQKCWKKIEERKLVPTLRKDVVLNFQTPIPFASGKQDKLVVTSVKGRRVNCADADGWGWYRLTRDWINHKAAIGELSFSRRNA